MPIPHPLDPPARLLRGPVPSDVEPALLAAMCRPMLGHLDPAFHAVGDEAGCAARR
jgi:alanine-glyoxylate transaminase / serine-glyoxylate transaminase / serine-pyruvate transaminase